MEEIKKELTEEEENQIADFKRYYLIARRCKKCKRIYGSDDKHDNWFCPICERWKKMK